METKTGNARMRKMATMLLLFLAMATSQPTPVAAKSPDNIRSLISLVPAESTQDKITSLFGQPANIEEGRRKEWWHYTFDGTNVTICWNKRTDELEKLLIENSAYAKKPVDERLKQLHSGTTDVLQVFNILGTPEDMTIHGVTHEMHYSFQTCTLRLFFRNNKLVDFTLLGQK